VALTAACSASTVTVSTPSGTTPAATSTAAPPATPATSASGNAPATTSPATASGLAACSSRYLRGDLGLSQGTAGSVYQVITFTNLNNVPCTMYGYPGVALANGTPVTDVGAPADRDHTATPTRVTLQPQGVASATLRIADAGNFPSAQCKIVNTTWLSAIPPGQYVPLYVPYKTMGCSDSATHLLTITPVVPGNGGSS
jgi:hypothetical protein